MISTHTGGNCEEYLIEDLWQFFCGCHSSYFPHNYFSSTMTSAYTEIVHKIINEELLQELASLVQEDFLSVYECEWITAVKDYVQYLVVWVVGNGLGINTSPPDHVDCLWTMHLIDSVSYRKLEKVVIKKVKEINEDIVQVKHIDHSRKSQKSASRLKATRTLYSFLGFIFSNGDSDEHNSSEQMSAVGTIESARPKIAVTPKKQDARKLFFPAEQIVITGKREEGDGDKKEKDTLDLILKLTGTGM